MAGGNGGGGEGEENIGGGGMTPMSVTPMESIDSLACCPEGVTRSLGSIDSGFTVSFPAKIKMIKG